MKHRLLRVNELLKRELSSLIAREITFEGALVTVNQVDVTPDLKIGARLTSAFLGKGAGDRDETTRREPCQLCRPTSRATSF